MSQQGLLSRVVGALERAGVGYMVSGSLVSSLQGAPRMTHDVDVVVSLPPASVAGLAATLSGPTMHLDVEAATAAARDRSMFNLVDETSGDKVDFWLLTDEPYDEARFARRILVEALGLRFAVSAPEDTILMKLRWAALSGGSERQVGDAVRVYEVQAGSLDEGYLDDWAARLGVDDLLARVRSEAEPLVG